MKRLAAYLTVILGVVLHIQAKLDFNCNTLLDNEGNFEVIKYKKGVNITICLQFLPYGVKMGFKVPVDEYVGLSIRRGYESLTMLDTDFTVQLENSESFSNLIVS